MGLLHALWMILQPVIGYVWYQCNRVRSGVHRFILLTLFIALFTLVGCISEKLFYSQLGGLMTIVITIGHVYATKLWKLLFEDLM